MKKKILSALLTVCIGVLVFACVGVFAADSEAAYGDFTYDIYKGGAEISKFNNDTFGGGDLVIPSEIDGYPVTAIKKNAFVNCDKVTSITIPDTVKKIYGEAIVKCEALRTVFIPASVVDISRTIFVECFGLESIEVDANNSRYTSVDGVMFNKDKTELHRYPSGKEQTSYVIPSSVEFIYDSAFEDSQNLETVEIPDSVTSIYRNAFLNCEKL